MKKKALLKLADYLETRRWFHRIMRAFGFTAIKKFNKGYVLFRRKSVWYFGEESNSPLPSRRPNP